MTQEEALKAIDELKAQGATEENIVASMYMMFRNDEIDVNELSDLVKLVGYELTDEFMNMSAEDQKTKFFEDEFSNEEIEDAKEITSEEAKENKESEDTPPQGNPVKDGDDKEEPSDAKDDEEEERKQARKLFGLD